MIAERSSQALLLDFFVLMLTLMYHGTQDLSHARKKGTFHLF